ncbi:hypothetical protein H5410_055699, partial [Solanum commersonii]
MKWLWRYANEDRALCKEVIMENMDSQVNSALVKWSALIVYQFGGLSETYGLALTSMLSTINLEATVADPWTPQGWICFRRNLNDREIDRVVDLMKEVDEFKGTSTVTDAMEGSLSIECITWRSWGQPVGKAGPWSKWLEEHASGMKSYKRGELNYPTSNFWTMLEHTTDLLSWWIKKG